LTADDTADEKPVNEETLRQVSENAGRILTIFSPRLVKSERFSPAVTQEYRCTLVACHSVVKTSQSSAETHALETPPAF
jgi:hypothetical protein